MQCFLYSYPYIISIGYKNYQHV